MDCVDPLEKWVNMHLDNVYVPTLIIKKPSIISSCNTGTNSMFKRLSTNQKPQETNSILMMLFLKNNTPFEVGLELHYLLLVL